MREVYRLMDGEGDFVTRANGARVRAYLAEKHGRLATGDKLAIDFTGVNVMTPSFADECFGKLAERIGATRFRASISLIGATETIRTLVNTVLSERLLRARPDDD